MSGFKDDVISILKQNSILQKEGVGLIEDSGHSEGATELYKYLTMNGFLVFDKKQRKTFFRYDYVAIHRDALKVANLVYALTYLNTGGIIVLDITGLENSYEEKFVSLFAGLTGTKVKYQDRTYIVIHSGVDYGD